MNVITVLLYTLNHTYSMKSFSCDTFQSQTLSHTVHNLMCQSDVVCAGDGR